MQVFILTVIDHADFGREKHKSAHATEPGAQTRAVEVIAGLQEKTEPEFRNSYGFEILCLEVEGC